MVIKEFPSLKSIHALVLPLTGFGDLLTSNMFVLGTGPVTLIDTGPKFQGAFESVHSRLNKAGFDFPDVERIIITHGHIDHFGMTSQIIRAAGHPVPCYLHKDDIWRTLSGYIRKGFWSEESSAFTRMAGMPEAAIVRMERRSAFFKHFCDPLEDVIPLQDGDIFTGNGFLLKTVHTPGHSPGSCCLYEEKEKVLFTGDHIIKHITPNPITEIHKSYLSDPSYKSLLAYENSLRKIEGLDVRFAFSGHGEYIDDLKALLSRYRDHHEKRKLQILESLTDRARPIYDLVEDLFPDVPENEIFLAVSEIFSHIEVLIAEGRAVLDLHGPPALFRAVS